MSETKRGTCPECGYRFRLRKDGTIGAHLLYGGPMGRRYCEGSGDRPAPTPTEEDDRVDA